MKIFFIYKNRDINQTIIDNKVFNFFLFYTSCVNYFIGNMKDAQNNLREMEINDHPNFKANKERAQNKLSNLFCAHSLASLSDISREFGASFKYLCEMRDI